MLFGQMRAKRKDFAKINIVTFSEYLIKHINTNSFLYYYSIVKLKPPVDWTWLQLCNQIKLCYNPCHFGYNWVMKQDNDTTHSSKSTTKIKESRLCRDPVKTWLQCWMKVISYFPFLFRVLEKSSCCPPSDPLKLKNSSVVSVPQQHRSSPLQSH